MAHCFGKTTSMLLDGNRAALPLFSQASGAFDIQARPCSRSSSPAVVPRASPQAMINVAGDDYLQRFV